MSSSTKTTIRSFFSTNFILLLLFLSYLLTHTAPTDLTMVKTKDQNAQEMAYLYKELLGVHDGSMLPAALAERNIVDVDSVASMSAGP
jgi:hypothetical protein